MKSIILLFAFACIAATGFAQKRHPYYGGGHHTTSHGGYYSGGSGSTHRGGHYVNSHTYNTYGRHKKY